MNNVLTYPEERSHAVAPGDLFLDAVEFIVDRVGLDNALDLLTFLLEAFLTCIFEAW
jgi:hypothetical protein